MRKYWIAFAAVIVTSFLVLIAVGVTIYQQAPPIPERVVTPSGTVVMTGDDIRAGQNVWQSLGGMQMGSVWGHGAYVAPDWTADWLHREATSILDEWSQRIGASPGQETPELRAALEAHLKTVYRTNTYVPENGGVIVIDDARGRAFERNAHHYANVFAEGRNEYAIPSGTLTDAARQRQLAAFFFWTAWAASTERPGSAITYTSNWPAERLVGNTPTPSTVVWTGVSIILLLAGIGGMAWWHASQPHQPAEHVIPEADPLLSSHPTPSQRATVKYFWVVSALILAQILLGIVVAHYGVEGSGLYGLPLARALPYVIARTWHVQLGIFWIATAWLATGLFVAPAVGVEPRAQRFGVNLLFGALLVVVVGSLTGEWLSVKQKLSTASWFWLGHSGYEYIDLGRLWQIALFVGLVLWLALLWRAIAPALRRRDEQRPLLVMFLVSSIAITGFYAAAFGYGRHTNLAIAEYWRWWVVHLWVEGFFEVFATVVIAFLFARLGLVRSTTAARAAILSGTIFLAGGIIGTLHHLYFSGTPIAVLALGATFSALEVVPLVFVGFEAWDNLRRSRSRPWIRLYRWPIYCFIAVAFWNLVGAGLFGFMINPPIALYYMQGLNTTPVHGHTALFGVYGMLGIGLMLFCLRALRPGIAWNERLLAFSFWAINGGLMAQVLLSVLPVGLIQTWASVSVGYWYARSPELMQQPIMQWLRWLRVLGDSAFAAGAIALALFVLRLATGHAYRQRELAAIPADGITPTPSA